MYVSSNPIRERNSLSCLNMYHAGTINESFRPDNYLTVYVSSHLDLGIYLPTYPSTYLKSVHLICICHALCVYPLRHIYYIYHLSYLSIYLSILLSRVVSLSLVDLSYSP